MNVMYFRKEISTVQIMTIVFEKAKENKTFRDTAASIESTRYRSQQEFVTENHKNYLKTNGCY